MPTQQRELHRRVLDLIRRADGTTRGVIARDTGRSRSVIAQTVAELIAEGLVVDAAVAGPRGARGRPPMELRLAPRSGYIGGVDITHGSVAVAVAAPSGRVLHRRSAPTDADANAPAALDLARRLLLDCFAALPAAPTPLALGLALPFPVHAASATIHAPDALPTWTGFEPARLLAAEFGCPVRYDNDANLGAWAEHRLAPSLTGSSLLYVKAGDGVGTGFVVDGRVYSGAHGLGGEIGHSLVREGGESCRCGRRGCLEAEVSPAALARRLGPSVSADLAAVAAHPAGDGVLREAGWSIGRVVAQLSNFLDPARIVLGGALGSLGGPVLDGVRDALATHGLTDSVRRMPVTASTLGTSAELVGALDLAAQQVYAAAA